MLMLKQSEETESRRITVEWVLQTISLINT